MLFAIIIIIIIIYYYDLFSWQEDKRELILVIIIHQSAWAFSVNRLILNNCNTVLYPITEPHIHN